MKQVHQEIICPTTPFLYINRAGDQGHGWKSDFSEGNGSPSLDDGGENELGGFRHPRDYGKNGKFPYGEH